jgi:hypothetical protein
MVWKRCLIPVLCGLVVLGMSFSVPAQSSPAASVPAAIVNGESISVQQLHEQLEKTLGPARWHALRNQPAAATFRIGVGETYDFEWTPPRPMDAELLVETVESGVLRQTFRVR